MLVKNQSVLSSALRQVLLTNGPERTSSSYVTACTPSSVQFTQTFGNAWARRGDPGQCVVSPAAASKLKIARPVMGSIAVPGVCVGRLARIACANKDLALRTIELPMCYIIGQVIILIKYNNDRQSYFIIIIIIVV